MIFKKITNHTIKPKKLNGYLLLLTCIDCRKNSGCFLSVDTFILSHYHYSLEHTFNISKNYTYSHNNNVVTMFTKLSFS